MNNRSLTWRLFGAVFRFLLLVALLHAPRELVRFVLFYGTNLQDPDACRSLLRPLDGLTGPMRREEPFQSTVR